MTTTPAETADGKFLQSQLIYSGSTVKSLPKHVNFSAKWHVITTLTHWSLNFSYII